VAGQHGLAYVTAATYGLEEDAQRLADVLTEAGVDPLPALESGGELLAPPPPILREANWPLLTVSKGFFETLAAGMMEV
jgi:coatomer subunit alpha